MVSNAFHMHSSNAPHASLPKPETKGDKHPARKAKTGRSKAGCISCRQRRVKCDEVKPSCAACVRLQKECIWTREWKFRGLNDWVNEEYNKAGLTTSDALEVSSKQWEGIVEKRHTTPPADPNHAGLHFGRPPDPNRRENMVTKFPLGTFSFNLTPASFAQLPEYGGTGESAHESTNDNVLRWKNICLAGRSGVIELSVNDPSSLSPSSPGSSSSESDNSPDPWLLTPSALKISFDRGTRHGDGIRHLKFYEKVIAARIMPFVTKYGFNLDSSGRDVVVSTANEFPPLRHAVCAITLLSAALRGGPYLLDGAFYHYDQAISACLDYTDIHSSRFFYVHYLLLKFDVSCPTQGYPRDPRLAARHLQQLFKITSNQSHDTFSPLQAYLYWTLLFLDAQFGLAGNEEAGSFIRAIQENGNSLPDTVYAMPSNFGCSLLPKIQHFHLRLFLLIGEMSQEVVCMRKARRATLATPDELQARVDQMLMKAKNLWISACPKELQTTDLENVQMSAVARSTFKAIQIQTAVVNLYLHTSMYPGQRLHASQHEQEVAGLCTLVLSAIASAVANNEPELYNICSLFLAGVTSKIEAERQLAIELFRAMESSPLGPSARCTRDLVHMVHKAQERKVREGGRMEEVDWVAITREQEINFMGLF